MSIFKDLEILIYREMKIRRLMMLFLQLVRHYFVLLRLKCQKMFMATIKQEKAQES